MQYRRFGRTGLNVSSLGFGCGAVGGLLVKGDASEMVRVISHAIDSGINYFDTAHVYGNGLSESHLGQVLKKLRADVIVGTKVQLQLDEMSNIQSAVFASVEGSLRRLQKESVDLIQLHNFVAQQRHPERLWISIDDALNAFTAFEELQKQGKVRYWGFNGLGHTDAIHQLISTNQAYTMQACINLINPSAGVQVPDEFPFQNYQLSIDKAADNDLGVMAIRVLAGGALTGSTHKHPNAAQNVGPIGTGSTYYDDVMFANRFEFLVKEGYADSLVEAAIRFVIGKPQVSTALIGISSYEHLEEAIVATEKGPLADTVFPHLHKAWQQI